MPEYLLPDVGEGLTEAEIVTWRVKVGDVVAVNDIVVDIETAKSIVELPSPYAGEVTALLVAEGETVEVGTPIIAIGVSTGSTTEGAGSTTEGAGSTTEGAGSTTEGAGSTTEGAGSTTEGAAPAPEMEIDLSNPAASGGGEGESLVGRMKAERGPMRRARRGSASPASEAAAATQMQVQGSFTPGGAQSQAVVEQDEPAVPAVDVRGEAPAGDLRVLAKPPVRKLAKDLGVDLRALTPTGPDGTVTRADVESAASGAGEAEASRALAGTRATSTTEWGAAAPAERETREPIKGVRKMMAGAMVQSAFTVPHVTEWVTVDATATVELVARLRERPELRDLKVSPLLVLAKVALLALRRTPLVNSTWDEAAGEVVTKHYVNLGIAAATPRGLVVPNVKDAHALPLPDLARALEELTATAREGRTQPADMAGGTFTITNVGVFGVDGGTPIINPGESAILCLGAIKPQPWVVDGQVVPRQVMTLALSFDHRHIDGATGSRFLADVAAMVSDPGVTLLF